MILFPIAFVYNVIGFNPYLTQLIPLGFELYLRVIGYILLLLGIYQGILELCREFLLAKELFIRVTRWYGIKKGASSLIEKYVGRRVNKSRSITPENAVSKNIKADNKTKRDKLDKNKEKDKHPVVTKVVNRCISEKNEERKDYLHQDNTYNRKGKGHITNIIEEINKENSSYEKLTYRRKQTLVKERLPEHLKWKTFHMKCLPFLIPT